MYIVQKHRDLIECMATINPRLSKNLSVVARLLDSEEGPLPHIHVYWGDGKQYCSCISLIHGEYSKHHKPITYLPSKKCLEDFIKIMSSVWDSRYIDYGSGIKKATGYEIAVQTWVDLYEDGKYDKFKFDSSEKLIMPDYSTLQIKRPTRKS